LGQNVRSLLQIGHPKTLISRLELINGYLQHELWLICSKDRSAKTARYQNYASQHRREASPVYSWGKNFSHYLYL
jgi:hypothetical protein